MSPCLFVSLPLCAVSAALLIAVLLHRWHSHRRFFAAGVERLGDAMRAHLSANRHPHSFDDLRAAITALPDKQYGQWAAANDVWERASQRLLADRNVTEANCKRGGVPFKGLWWSGPQYKTPVA